MVLHWLVEVLHPPQKSERLPFWNRYSYDIKNDGIEAMFNCMTSLLNFIKICQLVQKLIGGTDRQDDDVISLHFSFRRESRAKKLHKVITEMSAIWAATLSPWKNQC
jgi:hypothetical protein